MKRWLVGSLALLLAAPAHAQLAPASAAGVTFGHVHLNVTDVELHKRLWVEHFDGVVVVKGSLTTVKVPGMLIALSERAPTAGSESTVMDHFGFKVRDIDEVLAGWRAAGYEVQREFTGVEGVRNAYLLAPDRVRVEVQEDPALSVKAEAYHVHWFAPEFEGLVGWYAEMFGAEPHARGTLATTADVPGQNLSFNGTRTERTATRGAAIDHIGFEVDDLKAFCEMLEAKGVTFDVPYREVPSIELAIAFFTDPSGVRVELTEGFDRW
jgi:catechol 2,3-dioxygenase-like lactoylglutathione lyase family enzyme